MNKKVIIDGVEYVPKKEKDPNIGKTDQEIERKENSPLSTQSPQSCRAVSKGSEKDHE